MGRLFWKFFLCILLAQITATIGIGGTFWLKNRAAQQERALEVDTSPPARMAIEAATATLEAGGSDALKRFLGKLDRMRVIAIDTHGRELLGRTVHPAMLNKARALLEQNQSRPVVREASGSDGVRYLLFLPTSEHFRNTQMGAAQDALNAVTMAGPRMLPPMPPGGDRSNTMPGAAPDMPPPGSGEPRDLRGQPSMTGMAGMGGPGPRMDSTYRNLIPIIAATAASLLFAFLLAWYFSRPIRALRLAFEAASNGDLAPRFQASQRSDELSNLGRDFDRMTGRLRSLMDSQTRLLHDVSHELRSPLARLQAAIGLAHQQPDKLEASLARIEREGVRMDKLIGELLTLSRMEAGAGNALHSDFSIADLLHDIVEDACYEAEARGVTLHVGGDANIAEVVVGGQPELLGRAVENVVRNAIKHSPDHRAVQVELSLLPESGQVSIAVLDRGPGVPAGDLEHIFQPFFRSSNTENATDGHGLGLAIAQHVIEAHGGAISARNRSSGGFCVQMVLPVKTVDGM